MRWMQVIVGFVCLSLFVVGSVASVPPKVQAISFGSVVQQTDTTIFLPLVADEVPNGIEMIVVAYTNPAFPEEEYVQIVNDSGRAVTIAGWSLRNATRPEQAAYVFPHYEFGEKIVIVVWSGIGTDDPTIGEFYWDRAQGVWRPGDIAELRSQGGQLIDTFTVME
ncbi:MAG: lamin tail domain-containing protein [Oscillochloris sp.]|nr:lamin tail domain-containing protein [Oscillochloris sp.]